MDDSPIPTQATNVIPHAHLLSNGRYRTLLTAAGSGYSQWAGCAITRWREDPTCDPWGSYVYVRDIDGDVVWSAGFQPTGRAADAYSATLSEGRALIERRDRSITTTTEVFVAADGDGEVRRISLGNDGDKPRDIEITSYAELVLAPLRNDAAHPAFSKLFVCTEYLPELQVLLATRRRQTPADQQSIWVAQWLDVENAVEGAATTDLQWDTDRANFIGRGGSLRAPAALADQAPLKGGIGTVLDPMFSLRRRVRVAAGATVHLQWWTVAADSREGALALVRHYRANKDLLAAREGALRQAQTALADIGIDAEQAARFQRLASALFYSDASLRASPEVIKRGRGGAPTLWAGGISGDFPIVLLRITDAAGLPLVDDLLRAHAFWSEKCVDADLVLLITASGDAAAKLDGELKERIASHLEQHSSADSKPHVFAVRGDQVADALVSGLSSVARIVLDAQHGTLAEQVNALVASDTRFATAAEQTTPQRKISEASIGQSDEPSTASAQLEYFNGYGGFGNDGREHVTIIRDGRRPPMPWLNVIANPTFGFTATEAGGGYVWSLNSQRNPLTPWANDPVCDPPQDVLYVRDEDDGSVWTATAGVVGPGKDAGEHVARHGQGYSRFQHHAHGIELDLLQYVPPVDGLKIARLRLRNTSGRARKLSVTAFVQWALDANGVQSSDHIVTTLDPATRALFASNAWRPEFGERVAFMDLLGRQTSHSGDRAEFIGHYGTLDGTLDEPAALRDGSPLSGRTGAGLDPCGALQLQIELGIDGEDEIVLLLGDADDADGARALLRRYRAADLDEVFEAATKVWDDILGIVQVKTPDRAMDLLLNRWLLYQTLSCRVWARTAYYQASGAYGFRDQLQDVMAVCVASPGEARQQLLRAAGRQFAEGDVQHWWLPPDGEGVRTRMTDDRLWLPFVAAHYIDVTADTGVLETRQPFLAGDALKLGQADAFFKPSTAGIDASLYEHCALAIDISLTLGTHELPLFGTGDWNDGMNRVGEQGRGESTWLGWFLVATIDAFIPHALAHGDDARVQRWQACATTVRDALDTAGWDGAWYRRGYYDDGTPLGSHTSSECRIDTIAQSWSVIAGGGDPAHASAAMDAVDQHLILRDEQLALLFTPPFDKTEQDPGYIKAYPPGIRENGGQYTHGALWSIFALAKLGEGDRAGELFSLINPINHAGTPEAVERYKVEPYVSCADVYSVAPHVGRGGWTWYTGSGAWLYRAGLEAILGFKVKGTQLHVQPCIPSDWPGFSIAYRHGSSHYLIEVDNPDAGQPGPRGIAKAQFDGLDIAVEPCMIPLTDDSREHRVVITLGAAAAER